VQEAEAIKFAVRNASLSADAVESLCIRLAQEITRSVLHFKRRSGLEAPVRGYLTGGGAYLTGLRDALAVKLKFPFERLEVPGEKVPAGDCDPEDAAERAFAFADLVGAAVTQLGPKQSTLNLLPPSRRQRVTMRKRLPWLIAATVLTLAVLLPPLFHFRNLADEARKKTAAIERELVPLRERNVRNQAKRQHLAELTQQLIRLQDVQARRVRWLGLLADLQDRLGRIEDVWLEKLQAAPAANGEPLRLVVSGRMLDRANPSTKASAGTLTRVKTLLTGLGDSPFVAAIERERFDNNQPGLLKFEFVLVCDQKCPL
jgi:type IV pilus assembly protein PilM